MATIEQAVAGHLASTPSRLRTKLESIIDRMNSEAHCASAKAITSADLSRLRERSAMQIEPLFDEARRYREAFPHSPPVPRLSLRGDERAAAAALAAWCQEAADLSATRRLGQPAPTDEQDQYVPARAFGKSVKAANLRKAASPNRKTMCVRSLKAPDGTKLYHFGVLLVNPLLAAARLKADKKRKVPPEWWSAFKARADEVGAEVPTV